MLTDRGRTGGRSGRGPWRWALAAGAVAGIAALTITSCNGGWRPPSPGAGADEACPRPPALYNAGGEFGDQERQIRHLRRLAFQGDFFAQLELGSRYAAQRTTDDNIHDPIESAVWYGMALANSGGFAPVNGEVREGFLSDWRPLSTYDDCRAFERRRAYRQLNDGLARLSNDERADVRDRMIYLLSTQGSQGYRTLARLHDAAYGPYGEPSDNAQAREAQRGGRRGGRRWHGLYAASSLFPRNDVDAYLYNYLATQTGDVTAYVMLQDFEQSSQHREGYSEFVESKARRWIAPFEFYPGDEPSSGVPHSDESLPQGEAGETALRRIHDLPFIHVGRALHYLNVTTGTPTSERGMADRDIETLEAMLGHPMEGDMSDLERVRAIQMAAERGSPDAQLVLAVMYSEGIGVPTNYARSFHWFEEAARQGSPEANFALSTYFALGVQGVADQDKAQAVVLRLESALVGFRPTISRLQAVLAQVSRNPHSPRHPRSR